MCFAFGAHAQNRAVWFSSPASNLREFTCHNTAAVQRPGRAAWQVFVGFLIVSAAHTQRAPRGLEALLNDGSSVALVPSLEERGALARFLSLNSEMCLMLYRCPAPLNQDWPVMTDLTTSDPVRRPVTEIPISQMRKLRHREAVGSEALAVSEQAGLPCPFSGRAQNMRWTCTRPTQGARASAPGGGSCPWTSAVLAPAQQP